VVQTSTHLLLLLLLLLLQSGHRCCCCHAVAARLKVCLHLEPLWLQAGSCLQLDLLAGSLQAPAGRSVQIIQLHTGGVKGCWLSMVLHSCQTCCSTNVRLPDAHKMHN
jgi:hypothetical protein